MYSEPWWPLDRCHGALRGQPGRRGSDSHLALGPWVPRVEGGGGDLWTVPKRPRVPVHIA